MGGQGVCADCATCFHGSQVILHFLLLAEGPPHLIVMSCVLGVLPSPLRVDLLWGLEMGTCREAVGMEGNGCLVLSAQVLEADRPNSSISSLCDLGPALLMLGASFVLIWKMGTIRIPTS